MTFISFSCFLYCLGLPVQCWLEVVRVESFALSQSQKQIQLFKKNSKYLLGCRQPLCTVGKKRKTVQLLWKKYNEKLKTNHHMIQQFYSWAYNKRIGSRLSKKYLNNHVHGSIIHSSQNVEATEWYTCTMEHIQP